MSAHLWGAGAGVGHVVLQGRPGRVPALDDHGSTCSRQRPTKQTYQSHTISGPVQLPSSLHSMETVLARLPSAIANILSSQQPW